MRRLPRSVTIATALRPSPRHAALLTTRGCRTIVEQRHRLEPSIVRALLQTNVSKAVYSTRASRVGATGKTEIHIAGVRSGISTRRDKHDLEQHSAPSRWIKPGAAGCLSRKEGDDDAGEPTISRCAAAFLGSFTPASTHGPLGCEGVDRQKIRKQRIEPGEPVTAACDIFAAVDAERAGDGREPPRVLPLHVFLPAGSAAGCRRHKERASADSLAR